MGSISSKAQQTQPRVPSELDVVTVRTILIGWLPPELADNILQQAEYWPMIHASCLSHFELGSTNLYGTNDASYCCLITPPIPTASRLGTTRQQTMDQPTFDNISMNVRRKVKSVTFKFTSRDQGWGGEVGLKWPYAGSWTWFNAEIWRPLPTFNTSPLEVGSSVSARAEIKPMMESPSSSILQAAGYLRVQPPSTVGCSVEDSVAAWLVQCNRRADSSIRRHTVIWTDTKEIGYNCQEDRGQEDNSHSSSQSLSNLSAFVGNIHGNEQNVEGASSPSLHDIYGCGTGDKFVCSLQPGDRIAIIARAKYLGWCNRVHGNMSVDIAYSIT